MAILCRVVVPAFSTSSALSPHRRGDRPAPTLALVLAAVIVDVEPIRPRTSGLSSSTRMYWCRRRWQRQSIFGFRPRRVTELPTTGAFPGIHLEHHRAAISGLGRMAWASAPARNASVTNPARSECPLPNAASGRDRSQPGRRGAGSSRRRVSVARAYRQCPDAGLLRGRRRQVVGHHQRGADSGGKPQAPAQREPAPVRGVRGLRIRRGRSVHRRPDGGDRLPRQPAAALVSRPARSSSAASTNRNNRTLRSTCWQEGSRRPDGSATGRVGDRTGRAGRRVPVSPTAYLPPRLSPLLSAGPLHGGAPG